MNPEATSVLLAFDAVAARRKRQRILFGLIGLILVVVISVPLALIAWPHIQTTSYLSMKGVLVEWSAPRATWKHGGTTTVRFRQRRIRWDDLDFELGTLPKLVNVESLDASMVGPFLSSEGLRVISRLKGLKALRLGYVYPNGGGRFTPPLTDADFAPLKALTSLQKLSFEDSWIGDGVVAHLAALPNLEVLNLSGTRLTDAGLVHLRGLTRLRDLNLEGTSVTPEAVAALKQALPNLKTVLDGPFRTRKSDPDNF